MDIETEAGQAPTTNTLDVAKSVLEFRLPACVSEPWGTGGATLQRTRVGERLARLDRRLLVCGQVAISRDIEAASYFVHEVRGQSPLMPSYVEGACRLILRRCQLRHSEASKFVPRLICSLKLIWGLFAMFCFILSRLRVA